MKIFDQDSIRSVADILACFAHDTASGGEYDADAIDLMMTLVNMGWTPPA